MDKEQKNSLLEEYAHAKTIQDDIYYLGFSDSRHSLRMVTNFEKLLELALAVVNAENPEAAIEELEEYLR